MLCVYPRFPHVRFFFSFLDTEKKKWEWGNRGVLSVADSCAKSNTDVHTHTRSGWCQHSSSVRNKTHVICDVWTELNMHATCHTTQQHSSHTYIYRYTPRDTTTLFVYLRHHAYAQTRHHCFYSYMHRSGCLHGRCCRGRRDTAMYVKDPSAHYYLFLPKLVSSHIAISLG